jgi:spermidine/putrescine transport system ATP-binding protein
LEKAVLELRNLSKHYGDLVAVDNVSLKIRHNELFCLLGPSGSGKTTILRMIAGFEKPTTGQILLEGKDISKIPPHKRNVNTVFQNYALFPHLNVRDNIAYGLQIRKFPQNEIENRVKHYLEIMHLPDKRFAYPHQLSGGQQQRVALARALINEPAIILLDEPLGALDEKLRDRMQVELSNIQRTVKTTFIMVTHNQEESLTMADRIAVMRDGNIEQLGLPEEIYSTPTSRFVAEFIGDTNILEGNIIFRDGDFLKIKLATGDVIQKIAKRNVPEIDEILLSIRPEQLRMWKKKPEHEDNLFEGIIRNEVFYGDFSIFIVELKNGLNVQVMFQNILPSGVNKQSFQEKEQIWVGWTKLAGHLLWD